MTTIKHYKTGQPDGQHHNTHPVDHLQYLIGTTPLHTTRLQPDRTHQHLARAERIIPLRKTTAQRARHQRLYPSHILNGYDRHCQRSFDPDTAFQQRS